MTDHHASLDAALARTRPDEHAAQIVHRILCIRCRMDWHCGGLSEDDYGEAGRIADLLVERDARVAAEAEQRGAQAVLAAMIEAGSAGRGWDHVVAAARAAADRGGDR